MQLRSMTLADLDSLDDIDATIEAAHYFHVDRQTADVGTTFILSKRERREKRIDANRVDENLRLRYKHALSGITESFTHLAEHDGQVVGSLLASIHAEHSLLAIDDLRVDYDLRREGLGTMLMFAAINAAREQELRAVRVAVRTDDWPMVMLLQKLGFEWAGLDTFARTNHDLVKEQATLLFYLGLN